MKQAQILKPDKTPLLEFDIPGSLHDVPLPRFIDFIVESRSLSNESETTAIVTMTKAVAAFYNISTQTLFDAAAGLNTDAESFAGSVSSLYAYATRLIADFTPKLSTTPGGRSFTYKGDKYTIPAILEQAIAGEFILPDLTVGEVIEVSELSRFREQTMTVRADRDGALKVKFDKMVNERIAALGSKPTTDELNAIDEARRQMYREQVETDGDPDGSLMFTYYLKLLAALTRRDGENLPVEDSTREHWLQSRAAQFQEIDAATALDVDFFLTDISQSYDNGRRVGGFLKSRCFAVVAATRLKSAKRLNGRRNTRKKFSKKSAGVK
jgi:hypothetical protein